VAQTSVIVHAEAELLAQATAARLLVRMIDAQAARGSAGVVLTGGRIAKQLYAAVKASPARDAVDWSRVDLWWGDERFVPAGDPERNETQARAALLDALPLDPARVHPMAASDGPDGDDPDAAAKRYRATLDDAHFDVVLLGVGEDGHVASIFPGYPGVKETHSVFAVRDSPKPPPTRLSLGLATINAADEVWLIAAGSEKAESVGQARGGAELPAGLVHGTSRTLWLLDRAAAAAL
jgi:6-phosphogluconolactonase